MLKRSLSLKWNFLPFYMLPVQMSIDITLLGEIRTAKFLLKYPSGRRIWFRTTTKNASKMKPKNRKFRNLLFSAIEIIFIFIQGKKYQFNIARTQESSRAYAWNIVYAGQLKLAWRISNTPCAYCYFENSYTTFWKYNSWRILGVIHCWRTNLELCRKLQY